MQRYIKQGSEMGVCFGRGPAFGRFFLGALLLEEFLWGLWEICKMPCRQVSLSTGALLRTWRGFICRDFWEKRKSISGFLSWTQRPLRFSVWGPS